MDNNTLKIKIKQRLNKLDSFDNDNIECWQMAEAFNKAQLEFVRATVKGYNPLRENRESGLASIDDLQVIVKERPLSVSEKKKFAETELFPEDYLYFKSVRAKAQRSTCTDPQNLRVFVQSEADADDLLLDPMFTPSFEWRETFLTILGNKMRIYTNGDFKVSDCSLVYYRKPRNISFDSCTDIATGNPTSDVTCEFKDDIVELILDNTVSILAGDLDHYNQMQRNAQNANKQL